MSKVDKPQSRLAVLEPGLGHGILKALDGMMEESFATT
jgi:hypothetical protein